MVTGFAESKRRRQQGKETAHCGGTRDSSKGALQRGLVASPVKSSSANESVPSPQKKRSLFGGLHEDTLKLIMDMVPEDGAFVVQLSCKTLHSPVRAFLLCVRKD